MKLTFIILAGGKSSRIGKDKAFIPYNGKPLIRYSIDLASSFTGNIIISANEERFRDLGFPVVPDIYPVNAPLAGIHAGLKFSETDWNLLLTCDMPNISSRLVDYLITKLEKKILLVLPAHDGYTEPLCGLYHKKLVPEIESNFRMGRLSPLDLLEKVPHRIIQLEDAFDKNLSLLFKNINERKDLFPG